MPSNATDTRIVQMQFDNREFERNIARSEKSLDKFKQALDFNKCEKSLTSFGDSIKHLSFDSMAENLQRLTDKFTGLGTASEYVLSRIRRGLEGAADKARSFFNSMTTQQVAAGFDKFADMNKNIQTIMAATGKSEKEVYDVMRRLNDYTDQTSYDFTSMAANIGKFTSVGIDLASAERQMEGIANWAARSGGSINEASRAMYNLSQAMGVGALTKIDWKSIENAGMATKEFKEQLIKAGVAAGTLEATTDKAGKTTYKTAKKFGKQVEVTYQNLAETLSKKWADTSTMQRAFESYYYDFKEQHDEMLIEVTDAQREALNNVFADDEKLSKQDWKTLKSQQLATDEVKQAAIDAAVAQGNLVKETTKDGKTIYKTAKKYGKEIEVTLDTFEESLETGWLDRGIGKNVWAFDNLAKASFEAAQKCLTFQDVLNAWKDQLSTGWMQSYQKIFGDLSESMELFSNICNKVGEALGGLIEYRNNILDGWVTAGGRKSLWSLVVGEVTDEGEAVAYKGVYGLIDVFGTMGKLLKTGFEQMIYMLMPDEDKATFDKDGEKYLGVWIGAKIKEAMDNVRRFIQAIRDFFNKTAPGQQKTRFQQIQDVVNTLFTTFVIAKSVIDDISSFVASILEQLTPTIDAFLLILSELGLTIQDTADDMNKGKGLKVLFDELLVTLKPLTTAINEFFGALAEVLTLIFRHDRENDDVLGFWAQLASMINEVAKVVVHVATPIIDFFTKLVKIFGDLFKNGFSAESWEQAKVQIKQGLKTMFDSIFSFVPDFSSKVKGFYNTIVTWFQNGFKQADWEQVKAKIKSAGRYVINALPDGIKTGTKSVYGKVKSFLKKTWTTISKFFQSSVDVFKNNFSEDSLKNLKAQIKSIWQKVVGAIPEGVKTGIKSAFEKVKTFLKDLWAKIKGLFQQNGPKEDSRNLFQKIIDAIVGAYNNLKASFQRLVGNMEGDAASFKESLKKINWSAILYALIGIGGVAGIALVVVKVIKVIKEVAKAINTISTFATKGLKALLPGDEDEKAEGFADKLLKIAGAIAIMSACVVVIGNMKAEDAWRALGIIGILSVAMIGILAAVKALSKKMDVKESLAAFIAMYGVAAAVGRMVSALLPLAGVDMWELSRMMMGLTGVISAIIAVSIAAKKGALDFKSLAGVLAFAGGIWLLVNTLLKLKDISKPEEWARMGGGLSSILLLLLGFAVGMHKLGGSLKGSGMKQAAFLAAAIGVLVLSLLPLARLEWDQLGKMGAGLAAILVLLGLFTWSMKKLSMDGKGMTQLIALAGSIAILVLAMLPLAILPAKKIEQALHAVIGLLVMMAAAVILIGIFAKDGTSGKGLAQLLALAGSIVILVLAMMPLALLPMPKLNQAMQSIIFLVGLMTAAVILINHFAKDGLKGAGMAQLLLLALSIAGVVVVLMPLALMEWDQILKMGAALIAILGMFALILKTTKKLKVSEAASSLLVMIGLAGLIFVFGSTLANLPKDMNWKAIAAFSVGLAAVIAAVGIALKFTKGLSMGAAVKGIVILSAAVAAMMGVVGLLAPWLIGRIGGSLQQMSAQLSLIGGMFSDFIGNMNTFSEGEVESTKKKFDKILDLVRSMSDVSGLLYYVHDFSECLLLLGSGLHQFMFSTSSVTDPKDSNGMKMLEKFLSLKDQLSEFTGGQSVADHIAMLGSGLQNFQTATASIDTAETPAIGMLDKLLGFSDKLSSFNGAIAAGIQLSFLGSSIGVFATSSGEMTDANPVALQFLTNLAANAEGLKTLSELNLDTFSSKMSTLGGALAIYALGAKEAAGLEIGETPDVSGAIAILHSLTEGLAGEDGKMVIPEMPTEDELSTFGAELAALAGGLIKFADASKGLGDTQKALDVLSFMSDMKAKLTTENLRIANTFGNAGVHQATLTSFGIDIAALGSSMANYCKATKSFVKNKQALDVIDFFYDLQKKLTQDQILSSPFTMFKDAGVTSTTTLTNFGNQISALGTSMKTYCEAVSGFVRNKEAEDAITFFYELQKKLLEDQINAATFHMLDGVSQETLSSFGTDIGALGDALAGFAANVQFSKEGKKADFDAALGSLDTLSKLSAELPKYGGLKSLWEGSTRTLTELSGDIRSLGEAMAQFSDALSSVGQASGKTYDTKLVSDALTNVQAMADILTSFASLAGDDLFTIDAFAVFRLINDLTRLMSLGQKELSEVTIGYGQQEGSFIDNLVNFMLAFKGASDKVGLAGDLSIFEAFKNLALGIQSMAAASPDFNFKPIGTNMVEGLKLGITEGQAGVVQAMVDVAVAAYKAAQEALDEHSPSRIFHKIGSFASAGLALGIQDGETTVTRAGTDVATSAVNATSGVLSSIRSLLLGDMIDADPTIRPVLDLTNVNAGAAQINSLLGGTYGPTIDPSVSGRLAASVAGGTVDANVTGADYTSILERIDAATARITELGGQISKMKLYLNTGALVGGITDDVDANIGRKAFYERRRN